MNKPLNDLIKRTETQICDLFKRIPNLEIQDLEDTLDRALSNLEEDYIGELGGEIEDE